MTKANRLRHQEKERAAPVPTEPDHPWSRHFWTMGHALEELRGKDLACWCGPDEARCHADVLLELANTPTEEGR
jgi:hypothetical protein